MSALRWIKLIFYFKNYLFRRFLRNSQSVSEQSPRTATDLWHFARYRSKFSKNISFRFNEPFFEKSSWIDFKYIDQNIEIGGEIGPIWMLVIAKPSPNYSSDKLNKNLITYWILDKIVCYLGWKSTNEFK